jgi:hypothetical protein
MDLGATSPPKQDKKPVGEIIRDQENLIKEINARLMTVFQAVKADGKFSDKACSVLSETLSRVKGLSLDSINITRYPSPEDLYFWAIANANIVFPYASLASAEANMKDSVYTTHQWGLKQGKYILPKRESQDSKAWVMLSEIIAAKHGDDVEFTAPMGETVPELSNSECAKNKLIDTMLIRILELSKAPFTATIRRASPRDRDEIMKNSVDFVLLEHIYLREKATYENMTLSGSAIVSGRRAQSVQTVGSGNKITITNTYQGYALAEFLNGFESGNKPRVPEANPLCGVVLGFIRSLVPDNVGNYVIPNAFFEVPSVHLRAMVREGPKIKTKKGEKHNLYVPFSFVKSSECVSMPEIIRREITDLGSDILKNVDSINKLTVPRASEMLPCMRAYIKVCYALSDECRREWKRSLKVPNTAHIRTMLEERFPDLSEETPEVMDKYISAIKTRRLSFGEAYSDPDEKAKILAEIASIADKRKSKQ